jgi:hypothetical protein
MRLIALITAAVTQGDRARSNVLFLNSSHEDAIRCFGLKGRHCMINIRLAFCISFQCNWHYEKGGIESLTT